MSKLDVCDYSLGTLTIGYSAFSYCSNLTSVVIPSSVSSIGEFAFMRCSSLSSIIIPNSITSLGNFVFMDCSGLTSIFCYAQQPPTLGKKVFEGVNKTIPLYVLANRVSLYRTTDQWKEFTNIVGIPAGSCGDSITWMVQDSVLVISGKGQMTDYDYNHPAPWAVYRNAFDSVVINEGITSVGKWAFSECSKIRSVSIPNSVTSIGERAFSGCSGLMSITIPDGITNIESYTFYNCSSLTSVTIPHNITTIQEQAFQGCNGLDSVICLASIPPAMGNNVFENVNCSAIPLYVSAQSVAAYRVADQWKDFHPILAIGATFATYTITFENWDGTELLKLTDIEEGTLPVYTGETPSRPDGNGFSYSFKEWTPQIVPATADVTYTATFEATPLDDSLEDVYAAPSGTKDRKVILNGYLYILRSGKTYTITGAEVKNP